MKVKLNGWRRIGVVIVIIWFVSLGVWAIVDFGACIATPSLSADKQPKVKTMSDTSRPVTTAEFLKSLGVEDSSLFHVPTIEEVNQRKIADLWRTRGILALIIPFALWFCIEVLVIAYCWITRGFSSENS